MLRQRRLKDWITAYVESESNSEAPLIYQKWVAISTVAAVLQRKVYLPWNEDIYPNMYIVLVGSSGVRKGTAMRPGRKFLVDLDIPLSADSITREALINTMKNLQSYYVDSVTNKNILHSSITVYSPELAVFIGYNNPALITALTDWYDCQDPWIYKTRNHGEERIEKTWVNLIGATTPDLLQAILPQDAIGGGLTSRIIFVFANKPSKVVVFPHYTDEQLQLKEYLLEDLRYIMDITGKYEMDDLYRKYYEKWYLNSSENPPFKNDERFGGYLTRRALHLKKLSIIIAASRRNELYLTGEDFTTASKMLEEVELRMPDVYASYGRIDYAKYMRQIETILAHEKTIPFQELAHRFMRDLEREELNKIIATFTSLDPPVCFVDRETLPNNKTVIIIRYNENRQKKMRGEDIL